MGFGHIQWSPQFLTTPKRQEQEFFWGHVFLSLKGCGCWRQSSMNYKLVFSNEKNKSFTFHWAQETQGKCADKIHKLSSWNCCFVRELKYPYQLLFVINATKQSGCKLTNYLPLKMHLLARSNCYFVKKLNDVSFMSRFFKYSIHNFRYLIKLCWKITKTWPNNLWMLNTTCIQYGL